MKICSKSRPKTMDKIRVLELHFSFLKKKREKERKKKFKHIKSRLQAGGASSLTSAGEGKVLASSSIFTSSKLVWKRELVAVEELVHGKRAVPLKHLPPQSLHRDN